MFGWGGGGTLTCELPGCQRPRWESNGTVHEYCGRSHALQATRGQVNAPHGNCHQCKLDGCEETVYFEEAAQRVHDFCCKGHADIAIERGDHPRSERSHGGGGAAAAVPPAQRCCLPGCSSERFTDADTGFQHDFCGRTHAVLARERAIVPPDAQLHADRSVVERSFGGRDNMTISVMTNRHPKYQSIKRQFAETWRHPTAVPRVERILQIRNPDDVYSRYEARKGWLQHQLGDADEVRRFHGTSLSAKCSFGIALGQPPCDYTDCALCRICSGGFQLSHVGSGAGGWGGVQRYGNGLYFSGTSSKSNDYAIKAVRGRREGTCCAMFMCKVLRGQKYSTPDSTMTQQEVDGLIGSGFTSVEGLPGAGPGTRDQLNYDELVVYNDADCIPSYIIVYKTD